MSEDYPTPEEQQEMDMEYGEEYQAQMAELYEAQEKAQENMPEPVQQTIQKSTQEAQKAMSDYHVTEMDAGVPQPQVWRDHQPQHQENIKNLQQAGKAYQENRPEPEKQAAIKKVQQSMQDTVAFFTKRIKELQKNNALAIEESRKEREQLMETMKQMAQVIQVLQDELKNNALMANQNYAQLLENYQKLLESQKRLTRETEEAKAHWHVKPLRYQTMDTVRGAADRLKSKPMLLKKAIQDRAYERIDKIFKACTNVLNRASSHIEIRRKRTLSHIRPNTRIQQAAMQNDVWSVLQQAQDGKEKDKPPFEKKPADKEKQTKMQDELDDDRPIDLTKIFIPERDITDDMTAIEIMQTAQTWPQEEENRLKAQIARRKAKEQESEKTPKQQKEKEGKEKSQKKGKEKPAGRHYIKKKDEHSKGKDQGR